MDGVLVALMLAGPFVLLAGLLRLKHSSHDKREREGLPLAKVADGEAMAPLAIKGRKTTALGIVLTGGLIIVGYAVYSLLTDLPVGG